MKTVIIIPIRGIKTSMSRIRGKISPDKVSTVVYKLFQNTMELAAEFGEEVIVLTADPELMTKLRAQGHRVYFDDGSSLNQAIQKVKMNFKFDQLLILMPDLPGLTKKSVLKIKFLTKKINNFIIPSYDLGTNVAYLQKELVNLMPPDLYGVKSSEKFIELSNQANIPLYVYHLNSCLRDLDTVDDWYYWGLN